MLAEDVCEETEARLGPGPIDTVGSVTRRLLGHPREYLFRRWNWKAAVFSAILCGTIFFFANLSAGLEGALGAMGAEFLLRSVTAGFYGAITQAYRRVEPAWSAALFTMLMLPLLNHSAELVLHWLRGTPRLGTSILASVCFTILSTSFNLHIMRRGAFITGEPGQGTLLADLSRMPRLVASFLLVIPLALRRATNLGAAQER
jgi:hypothetical protein